MKRFVTTLAALAVLVAASQAVAGEKIIVGFGLMHGTADIAAGGAIGNPDYNSAFQTSELGGRFEYWNMMKEHYALNFQGNIGFSSETDTPRSDAITPNLPDQKFTTSSWSVRLGGDRVWSPLPNTKVFFGPGIEYWTGKAKFEGFGGPTVETGDVTRISLHGHTGAIMMMGSNWGLSGQIGHKIGTASYEEKGGKVSWMPSSLDGAMELVFTFGDSK